jgi:hypothetical protein
MMRIKIEIVGDDRELPEKEVDWRIPLKWFNPFRFKHKNPPDSETAKKEEGEEIERPDEWVHPPFP